MDCFMRSPLSGARPRPVPFQSTRTITAGPFEGHAALYEIAEGIAYRPLVQYTLAASGQDERERRRASLRKV
jgi:hypothetical protein